MTGFGVDSIDLYEQFQGLQEEGKCESPIKVISKLQRRLSVTVRKYRTVTFTFACGKLATVFSSTSQLKSDATLSKKRRA